VWVLETDEPGRPVGAWLSTHPVVTRLAVKRAGDSRSTGVVHFDREILEVPLLLQSGPARPAARALRRFARSGLSRRVGLALSAGAAKGFAHVGVLNCFDRAGIEYDLIAGTSMGGILGGLYATERGAENLLQTARALVPAFRRMVREIGIPHTAL